MAIDSVTLRLIFILIPGIIVFGMVSVLAPKRARTNMVIFFQIFMYGVISYFIYYIIVKLFSGVLIQYISIGNEPIIFTEYIFNADEKINFTEIIFTSILAVLIGILVVLNSNYSILLRFMQRMAITNRYGDVDVWSYAMNSPMDAWVTARDRRRGLNSGIERDSKCGPGRSGAHSPISRPRTSDAAIGNGGES